MSDLNPYASPKAVVADVFEGQGAPPLWNPTAAGAWSLLFTPVFGAFLHMQNWKALGQPEKAAASKTWMLGSIAFLVAIMVSALFIPPSKIIDRLSNLSGLVLLIVWYYTIGKSQQTYVAERFGKTYPRRGWAIPLLSAVGISIAYIGFFALVAILLVSAGVISDTL